MAEPNENELAVNEFDEFEEEEEESIIDRIVKKVRARLQGNFSIIINRPERRLLKGVDLPKSPGDTAGFMRLRQKLEDVRKRMALG